MAATVAPSLIAPAGLAPSSTPPPIGAHVLACAAVHLAGDGIELLQVLLASTMPPASTADELVWRWRLHVAATVAPSSIAPAGFAPSSTPAPIGAHVLAYSAVHVAGDGIELWRWR